RDLRPRSGFLAPGCRDADGVAGDSIELGEEITMSNQKKPSMLNPYGWPDGPLPPAPSIPYQPWPVKIELLNEVPRYLLVVERIMEKALEHKKAGRTDSFRQVLVPMDDYQVLK